MNDTIEQHVRDIFHRIPSHAVEEAQACLGLSPGDLLESSNYLADLLQQARREGFIQGAKASQDAGVTLGGITADRDGLNLGPFTFADPEKLADEAFKA